MDNREFDVIIFGGTGYTGRYVIEELARSTVSTNIKWAIAGRNVKKLQESLQIVQEYLGQDINIQKTPVIEADVQNATSLSNMCKRAKLILNCVGPYKFFGEAVVQACIENGTHHVDLSGEIKYLETIQAKYFEIAREKKIYIIGACGFDSIPSDYGTSLLRKNFPGDMNSAETYFHIGVGPSGRVMNIGTLISAFHSFWDTLFSNDSRKLLEENVFRKELPKNKYPLRKKLPPLFYSSDVKAWCLWFLGPDEGVIERTQMFRHEYLNERPIQVQDYLQLFSFIQALWCLLIAVFFSVVCVLPFGASLLSKYPKFFTLGSFSNEGPTRQQVMEGTSTFTIFGSGWKDRLSDPTDQHTTKPDTRMKLTITGPEPTYPFTAACLVQSGLTIIHEKDNMPLEGGVLSPGVAFEKTSLWKRLEKSGVKFKFESC